MDPYIGEIKMFAGNYAPQGWATCDGQTLPISQNQALFALIGTYYGGDGVQTFKLPDLRSRAPIHVGQGVGLSPYSVGQVAGTEKVTLNTQQMPAHNHLVNVNATAPSTGLPTNAFLGYNANTETGDPIPFYAETASGATLNPTALSIAGGNQPVGIVQPVLAVTFIIALTGVWPPRQ